MGVLIELLGTQPHQGSELRGAAPPTVLSDPPGTQEEVRGDRLLPLTDMAG